MEKIYTVLTKIVVIVFLTVNAHYLKSQTANALNCDGLNDYVDPNQLISFSNNFTYEAWVRPTASIVIDPQSTSGITGINNQKYLIWPTWRNFDGGLGISVGTNGVAVYEHGSNFIPALLSHSVSITGWTHIAVVLINKQPILYINGVLAKTGLTSNKSNVYASLGACNQFPGQVGGIGGGTYGYYRGDVDEFRLWNVVRTQAQIQANMNNEFICPVGLYAYYKFNHGIAAGNNPTVTTATDYSGNNYTGALMNFALTGGVSNWVSPGGVVPGAIPLSVTQSTTSVCSGNPITLTASGATSYSWSPITSLQAIVVTSPTTTTTYTVTGTVLGGCTYTAAATVSVNPSPVVNVVSSASTICSGQNATLTASGATNYTFNPGGITGNPIAVSPTVTTTYVVQGTNSFGCSGSAFLIQNVSACTGIEEQNMNVISIYPNPSVDGKFNLNLNSKFNISVMDVTGRVIFESKELEENSILDLSRFNNGIYFIKAESEKGTIFRKLIKQ